MAAVYPHITINDTEEASLLQLDATNNTVLIPVPFAKRFWVDSDGVKHYDENEIWEKNGATLYMGAQEFMGD